MKRRGLFTKLFLSALAVPSIVKAEKFIKPIGAENVKGISEYAFPTSLVDLRAEDYIPGQPWKNRGYGEDYTTNTPLDRLQGPLRDLNT